MMRCLTAVLALGLMLVLAALPTSAQTPPSAADIAAYDGLHAAAWMGDVAAIERLVAAGAAVDTRDGQRRTALHIAAHARQREAMRTLVRLGADPPPPWRTMPKRCAWLWRSARIPGRSPAPMTARR